MITPFIVLKYAQRLTPIIREFKLKAMIKLGDNGRTNFFFDKWNMMLERADWANNHIGDALWRTVLALIASGLPELIVSVKSCIWKVDGKYRFFRHQTDERDTCSRDQSVMGVIAIKLYDKNFHKEVISNLDFRISAKFTWGDAWFWAKERYLLWRLINFYKFLFVYFDKSYSKHLFCWMIWSSRERMPMLRWLMKKVTHKENYLCRALLEDEFSDDDRVAIGRLKPMCDFIWQRTTPWKEGRYLTQRESEYNTLDIDVLGAVLNHNYFNG